MFAFEQLLKCELIHSRLSSRALSCCLCLFFFLSESQDGWTCLWGDEVKRKVWLIYRFTLQLLGFYFCILTDLNNNNNNNNNESHVYSKPFYDEFFFIMFFILEYFFSNISHLNRFDMGKEAQANLKALLH